MIPSIKKGFKLLRCPICNENGDKPLKLVRAYRKTCSSNCSVVHSYKQKPNSNTMEEKSAYWRQRKFNPLGDLRC